MNDQMSNGSNNVVNQSGKTMMDKRQGARRAQLRSNQIKSSLTVANRLKQQDLAMAHQGSLSKPNTSETLPNMGV